MTIMVIEDNGTNAMILKRLAEKFAGDDVVVEIDAGSALKRCHNELFSLFIVDQVLPGMSGIQFTKAVRMMQRYDQVAIVMVTADHEPGLREEAVAAGVTDFLTKPVDMTAFRDLLTRYKERHAGDATAA